MCVFYLRYYFRYIWYIVISIRTCGLSGYVFPSIMKGSVLYLQDLSGCNFFGHLGYQGTSNQIHNDSSDSYMVFSV